MTLAATSTSSDGAERLSVYVDGFNLYHGLREASGRRWLWLDLVKLAQRLRPRSELVKLSYFTAPVLNDPGAAKRHQHYQDALVAMHPTLVTVAQGRHQSKTLTCRKCGNTWIKHEEKETDVSIAVALVTDSAQDFMDSALIISADSDLAPAVRAAHQVKPSLFVTAAFPPMRFSNELKSLMSASFEIGYSKIRRSLLPEEFQSEGRTYRRPQKWR